MGTKFNVDNTGQVTLELGSAALPSLSFLGDTDTGFYWSSANQISLALGAAASLNFTTSSVRPAVNGAITLGEASNTWGTLYMSDGLLGTPSITFGADTDTGIYRIGANQMSIVTGGVDHLHLYGDGTTQTVSTHYFANGAAATPSVAFFNDPDNGLYLVGTNTLGIATAGSEALRIDGQNNVGLGGAPVTNGILTLSSTTKAFVPTRMTTAQRNAIGTPTGGMIVFNTDTTSMNYYDGSTWQSFAAGGGISYPLLAPNGTAAAPSYSFSSSTGTGIFSSGSNLLDFTAGGTSVADMSSTKITTTVPVLLPTSGSSSATQLQIAAANNGFYTGINTRIVLSAGGVPIFQATGDTGPFFQLLSGVQFVTEVATNQILFDHGGIGNITLNAPAAASARTYTIPDSGTITANFMMTEGSQTVNGANTFSNDLTVGTRIVLTGQSSGQSISNNESYAGTLTWLLQNTNASGESRIYLTTPSGGGDPYVAYSTSSVDWAEGIDNSDSDKYKISYAVGTNVHFGTNDALVCTTSNQVLPGADNTSDLGISGTRWKNIWGVTVHTGDIALENDWRITEGFKVGYPEEGVMILAPDGRKFKIAMTEVE